MSDLLAVPLLNVNLLPLLSDHQVSTGSANTNTMQGLHDWQASSVDNAGIVFIFTARRDSHTSTLKSCTRTHQWQLAESHEAPKPTSPMTCLICLLCHYSMSICCSFCPITKSSTGSVNTNTMQGLHDWQASSVDNAGIVFIFTARRDSHTSALKSLTRTHQWQLAESDAAPKPTSPTTCLVCLRCHYSMSICCPFCPITKSSTGSANTNTMQSLHSWQASSVDNAGIVLSSQPEGIRTHPPLSVAPAQTNGNWLNLTQRQTSPITCLVCLQCHYSMSICCPFCPITKSSTGSVNTNTMQGLHDWQASSVDNAGIVFIFTARGDSHTPTLKSYTSTNQWQLAESDAAPKTTSPMTCLICLQCHYSMSICCSAQAQPIRIQCKVCMTGKAAQLITQELFSSSQPEGIHTHPP